ncbi:calcium channel YVC1 [Rhypophila decipiens]|uniref:Calcium channel YVC1 n=1 Tax=Rhypophila decipiens TaxID=261697 RepID=A0AAN6YCH5_9PEZI|nr:calcium channel YVC1 [Rhypophila decipiens]
MPIRVKSRPAHVDIPLRTPSPGRFALAAQGAPLPDISEDDTFREVVKKLSIYIADVILLPSTFEQLRTTAAGEDLRVLVDHLSQTCTHPAIVNALLALKWHYGAMTEDKGLNDARASSCEIVAWRFLTHLSEREAVDYCLYEIPDPAPSERTSSADEEEGAGEVDEHSALLAQALSGSVGSTRAGRVFNPPVLGPSRRNLLLQSISRLTMSMSADDGDEEEEEEDDPTAPFINLNALEIAAIADAKRFLSQNVVQKIITGIWNGDIIFWDNLSVHSVKKPRFYNPHTADPFSRLRVPKYLKSFEVLFFAVFLALYYGVLVERQGRETHDITVLEISLILWFAAFAYDELSEWIDAGSIFYAADVWNIFDMAMIVIGFLYVVLRIVGLETNNGYLIELAFDILALEALFMVPRVCSILSLSPYWGTLIPCLKEMGKDFIKFMVLVVVIYLGFLTTFTLIGRKTFTLATMAGYLTKIFFGSTFVGLEIMWQIDAVFGPPLMILFVMLSSILLMGSLTGMLSNSFGRVITHAREEYLYVYSVYVLEASTSNRLTHFYPPFNLLALVIFRPLRLFLPSDDKFRSARIVLLKATHLPIVAAIEAYEWVCGAGSKGTTYTGFRGPRHGQRGMGRGHGGRTIGLHATSSQSPKKMLTQGPEVRNRESTSSLRPSALRQASQQQQQQYGQHLSPNSMQVTQGRSVSRSADEAAEEVAMGEPLTDVEVKIAELSLKIDRLTELVISMQAAQAKPLGSVAIE